MSKVRLRKETLRKVRGLEQAVNYTCEPYLRAMLRNGPQVELIGFKKRDIQRLRAIIVGAPNYAIWTTDGRRVSAWMIVSGSLEALNDLKYRRN